MRIPMPSPAGTNFANLFIDSPGMAFDARPRYARDQADKSLIRALAGVINDLRPKGVAADAMAAPDHDLTDGLDKLRDFLHTQLPHDVFQEVDEMIKTMAESARKLIKAVNVSANKELVGDQPPAFSGRPERGGKAMDGFNKRFPGAARIGTAPLESYGKQPAQRGGSQSADGFNKRFPNAARIGGV